MLLQRQMVIAADGAGRLLIHSCVALGAAEQARLEALDEPTWLVVPNGFHRLDAAAYKRRYPRLIVIAPEGSRARVAEVVDVGHTYREFRSAGGLELEQAPWPNAKEGAVRVRSGEPERSAGDWLTEVRPELVTLKQVPACDGTR